MALNGMLDSRWPGRHAEMLWYFCTMGYGHDAGFWKSFVLKLRAHGYDGVWLRKDLITDKMGRYIYVAHAPDEVICRPYHGHTGGQAANE